MSKILEGLNEPQLQAVINFEKPSLIIAGAGSGKTKVLTTRIAYMIEKGVNPCSILALTFTKKAATQMSERLAEIIPEHMVRQISMGTFHSVLSRIIRANAELLGYPSTYTIYTTSDSVNLLKSIVKELDLNPETYKPKKMLTRISSAKNSLITPDAYLATANFIAEDKLHKIPQFAQVYKLYTSRCKAAGSLDFDDLLLQANILFRDFPEVLAKYQEIYQYILVDEYQDTNYAQDIIIRRLAMKHHRVCVVGDDAQSIYAFRGAKIDNIFKFNNNFPGAMTFKLEQNYRSTQTIVNAANSLIAHNTAKLDKRCFSEGDRGEKIRIIRAATDRHEAFSIIDLINARRKDEDVNWSDIAILYRTNSQSQTLEQELINNNIPYQIHRGNSFYEQKIIKDMLAYIRLIINPRDDEAFKRIINFPARGIGAATLDKIELLSKQDGSSMWDAVDKIVELTPSDATQRTIIRKVKEFVAMIRELRADKESLELYDFGHRVASRSGILTLIKADKTSENEDSCSNVEELLNTMQRFDEQVAEEIFEGIRTNEERATIEEWMQGLMLLSDQDNDKESNDKVTLMTVHSSKGLEYKYIYIIGVEHNLFPSQRAIEEGEIEEERRLFYVAITRAKVAVTLSYCDVRMRWGSMEFTSPSSFLTEIDSQYVAMDSSVDLHSRTKGRSQINDGTLRSDANSFNPPPGRNPRLSPRVHNTYRGKFYTDSEERAEADMKSYGYDKRSSYDREDRGYSRKSTSTNSGRPLLRRASEVPNREGRVNRVNRHDTPEKMERVLRLLHQPRTPEQIEREMHLSPEERLPYKRDDVVMHDVFGRGRVVSVETNTTGDVVKIDFESVGTKSLLSKIAPMRKINE